MLAATCVHTNNVVVQTLKDMKSIVYGHPLLPENESSCGLFVFAMVCAWQKKDTCFSKVATLVPTRWQNPAPLTLSLPTIVSLDGSWSCPVCAQIGAQADNIRRNILKRNHYLMKSGIWRERSTLLRSSPIALSREIVTCIQCWLICATPFGNRSGIWPCPVSRRNHKQNCFNSGPISLSVCWRRGNFGN